MPNWNRIPPTPEQIARIGHAASAVRAALERLDLSPGDFNQRLGLPRKHTQIYNVLNCKVAIGPRYLAKYSKALGIPEHDLEPRELVQAEPQARVPRVINGTPLPRAHDVLGFSIDSDGNARLKLDLVASIETVTPVLRMLLDLGLVVSKGGN